MHRSFFLGALLLLQCGPKAPEADDDGTGAATTGPSAGTTTDLTTTTVADTTTTTTATTTPEPTTTGATTTGATTTGATTSGVTTSGECDGVDEGNVWVCQCLTNAGPWTPFNTACSRGPDDAIEWVEWLCEEYADEPQATGGTTSPDTGSTTADGTAGDTGSLGCMCTCEETVDCCDASLP